MVIMVTAIINKGRVACVAGPTQDFHGFILVLLSEIKNEARRVQWEGQG